MYEMMHRLFSSSSAAASPLSFHLQSWKVVEKLKRFESPEGAYGFQNVKPSKGCTQSGKCLRAVTQILIPSIPPWYRVPLQGALVRSAPTRQRIRIPFENSLTNRRSMKGALEKHLGGLRLRWLQVTAPFTGRFFLLSPVKSEGCSTAAGKNWFEHRTSNPQSIIRTSFAVAEVNIEYKLSLCLVVIMAPSTGHHQDLTKENKWSPFGETVCFAVKAPG